MESIFTKEKLFKAYADCKNKKKNTINALKFEINREKNLFKLLNELQHGSYKISRHICFVVTDPKPREIFAADFRDRIVHHLLYNEIIDIFEKDFIENSFANRKGKGCHKGIRQLKAYLETARQSWYLKLDIKSFFCSIDKDILFASVKEKILSADKPQYWKREILWITQKIIYNDPTQNFVYKGDKKLRQLIANEKSLFYSQGRGLPIGNLTSQFFANIYLDTMDKYISLLANGYYIRYVDDFIILGGRSIIKNLEPIKIFLKTDLGLAISDKKIKFQPSRIGIDFLGYYIKPDYILVRKKVVAKFKKKIAWQKYDTQNQRLSAINSYFGHFMHASTYNLRRKLFMKILTTSNSNFISQGEYDYLKLLV